MNNKQDILFSPKCSYILLTVQIFTSFHFSSKPCPHIFRVQNQFDSKMKLKTKASNDVLCELGNFSQIQRSRERTQTIAITSAHPTWKAWCDLVMKRKLCLINALHVFNILAKSESNILFCYVLYFVSMFVHSCLSKSFLFLWEGCG